VRSRHVGPPTVSPARARFPVASLPACGIDGMEERGMPPLGLWVRCEETRLVGVVTVDRRARRRVSEGARKDDGMKRDRTHTSMNSSAMTDRSKYLVAKTRLHP